MEPKYKRIKDIATKLYFTIPTKHDQYYELRVTAKQMLKHVVDTKDDFLMKAVVVAFLDNPNIAGIKHSFGILQSYHALDKTSKIPRLITEFFKALEEANRSEILPN